MRAYAIDRRGDLDELRERELDDPVAGRGEVRLRVRAAAVNPADLKVLSGRDGGGFLHAGRFPLVLGFDFSGVVDQLGPGVSGLSEGDAVFGFLPYSRKNDRGSFAELVCASREEIALKPEGVSHVEAACAATTASTALQALRDKGGLTAAQRVLVNGASGGVGSYAVQIARNAGAEVWGVCSGAKADYVQGLGADHVIDYRTTALREIEQHFDIVVDAACTSSFHECQRIMRPGAVYVTLLPSLGLATGVLRSLWGSKACRMVVVASRRADLTALATMMQEGKLEHPIDEVFSFERLPDALRRLESGKAKGKVAIEMG